MKLKARNRVSPDFQMSSLTDIIFLLLIFFLLTSSLVSINALNILLPSSSSSTAVKTSVSISITEDKQYFFNKDAVAFEDLEGLLATALEGEEKPSVVLNAAKTVPLEEAIKVMEIAKNLGVEIVLATTPHGTK